MDLNARAMRLVTTLLARLDERRVAVHPIEGGGTFVDCGIDVHGGLGAGLDLARICLADLADVAILPGEVGGRACPVVQVTTDHPIAACLASQYAGWSLSEGKFFAMGSGPMRASAGQEAVFAQIGHLETATHVVGVLECRKPPPPAVFARIAGTCRVPASALTLLAAPTASLAGGVQVVARSVETALHKLHSLEFDLTRIVSAMGTAPLPPVAKDDLAAIGRTNDAILYGARVVLFVVVGDDASIVELGPKRSFIKRRRTTASRSRRSSRATATTFTPSTPTSSARPRSCFRTSRPAASMPSARSTTRSWRGRSSARDGRSSG